MTLFCAWQKEANSKSHLCAISLSQSVCELCVCVTVCCPSVPSLSFQHCKPRVMSWTKKKEQEGQELSNREHGRADKICYNKVTGSAGNSSEFIRITGRHTVSLCVFAARKLKERQLCNLVRLKNNYKTVTI